LNAKNKKNNTKITQVLLLDQGEGVRHVFPDLPLKSNFKTS